MLLIGFAGELAFLRVVRGSSQSRRTPHLAPSSSKREAPRFLKSLQGILGNFRTQGGQSRLKLTLSVSWDSHSDRWRNCALKSLRLLMNGWNSCGGFDDD